MKNIEINIIELGPIKNAKITLTPFMIFLGESGLGKSYVAMLCHYIYEVLLSSKRLNRFFLDNKLDFNKMKSTWNNSGTALIINKSSLEEWFSYDAIDYMKDMLNNPQLEASVHIKLPNDIGDKIEINYKEGVRGLVDAEDVYIDLELKNITYTVNDVGIEEESPFSFLLRHVLSYDIFGDYKAITHSYVLPPARAMELTEDVKPITGLYRRYSNWIRFLSYIPELDKRYSDIDNAVLDIIDGRIENKNNRFIYTTSNGVEMPVSASAASVRELAALSYLISKRDIKKVSILFEEPEAHLHPTKQRKIADLIARLKDLGTHLQITTHSDYFLRRLNEIISLNKIKIDYIKKLGEIEGVRYFNEECKKKNIKGYDINFSLENFSAYYFFKNEEMNVKINKEENFNSDISFQTFYNALNDDVDNSEIISDWIREQE